MGKFNIKQVEYEFNKTPEFINNVASGLKLLFSSEVVVGPRKVPNPDQNIEICEWLIGEDGFKIRFLQEGLYKNVSVRYPNGWYWTLFEGRESISIDGSSWIEIEDWYHKWIEQGSNTVDSHIFKVFGSGKNPYDVDMKTYKCSCPNFKYRCSNYTIDREERLCKHMLYVLDAYPEYKQKSAIQIVEEPIQSDGKLRYPRELFDSYVADVHRVMYQFRDIIERYEVCGSYRRLQKMVSDLDLLIQLKEGESWDKLLDYLESFMNYKLIDNIGRGNKKAAYMVDGLVHIDFKNVAEENWPFALMHFTGSKSENIKMRRKANQLGYSLNEYGLFKLSDETPVTDLNSEEDIYKFLEEPFKHPWER